ncbi:hypothetical protein sce2098 [Sorangium cellulosum So ce56]|uniref:Uncharacterized protein n=1 Tax=Sorangium cellulosum (strain So ce56) TaxID=448385 RepID=A9FVB4_SORC5|nr:putative baseplate assembly protein [Sorangium cellulosum]CAN92257.1 hypothetical protein sce2098 [Sorangium cellulosum So ce56]
MTAGAVFSCCDERRRAAVEAHGKLNGIDFLEVIDRAAANVADRQRELHVRFIKAPDAALEQAVGNGDLEVRIDGGVRITQIGVASAEIKAVGGEKVLVVRVTEPGDYSTYTLRLCDRDGDPYVKDFDPLLSAIDFSFKVECPSDFDCAPPRVSREARREAPAIDYLAKDYASFRRLMLDRLSLLLPGWREQNPADIGVTLVELLAYVGDHLSYQQDAVATEAYLGTARRRVSVRRHARLVDYAMHDGCNARVWIQIRLTSDAFNIKLPLGTRVYTDVAGISPRVAPDGVDPRKLGRDEQRLLEAGAACFETAEEVVLFDKHKELPFYTWGQRACCLPRGATEATLAGWQPDLKEGMVLMFEEVVGPRTGQPADADPAHRHAVRLTRVEKGSDPLGGRFLDSPSDAALDVTIIAWDVADALPFPLCISAQLDGGEYLDKVSVARGNIVLADHGVTLFDEPLDPVPFPDLRLAPPAASGCDRCEPCEPWVPPARYRPYLAAGPITQAATITLVEGNERRVTGFDPKAPAAAAMTWTMDQVRPAVFLRIGDAWDWYPQRDLLSSDAFARDFVVEVDDDGRAALRFGDDRNGARPAPGTTPVARYRVGNGAVGNVGAEALAHVATSDDRIEGARNPLPAKGGVDPESVERVRQVAPSAFRVSKRAVTPEDYAAFAEQHPEVQRAVATLRWTGSWRTVFITVDRLGGRAIEADFEAKLRAFLEPYRMAGQDIEIDGPTFVPLELDLHVCVSPDHYRSDVKAALLEVFSSGELPSGGRGFFHPDNFTFAQPVYVSRIYAAAQSVPGVRAVRIDKLQRLGVADRTALDRGELSLRRLEIAQLANDPSFPERGVLRLGMEGGR